MRGREQSLLKEEEKEKSKGEAQKPMKSIASLWSDIITALPRLARVWEMARDINVTRYRTWLEGGKKVEKVKMHSASGTLETSNVNIP